MDEFKDIEMQAEVKNLEAAISRSGNQIWITIADARSLFKAKQYNVHQRDLTKWQAKVAG